MLLEFEKNTCSTYICSQEALLQWWPASLWQVASTCSHLPHCCRIQAAQAAQAAASVPSVSDAPPPVPSEEPPPLPPLPPEQEEEGTQHPAAPPLPPPPPCEPPYPPHPVSLLTTQTQLQAAFNPHSVSQQSAQQHPGHYSHQQFTQQQPYDYSRQQGALQQPSFRTVQLPQGSNPSASRAAASRQGNGGVSAVQVKTEAVPNASFSAALPAVKTEAGTTVVQTGSRQQQGPQSGGAIQFGFGGRGKPSGKVSMQSCSYSQASYFCWFACAVSQHTGSRPMTTGQSHADQAASKAERAVTLFSRQSCKIRLSPLSCTCDLLDFSLVLLYYIVECSCTSFTNCKQCGKFFACAMYRRALTRGLQVTAWGLTCTLLCVQTAGMLRPLAKPGSKKPGLAVKSALAIFGSGDSDDE